MYRLEHLIKAVKNPARVVVILKTRIGRILFPGNDYVALEELRSASDNGRYIKHVKRAVNNPKYFKVFKKSAEYKAILEHTTRKQAMRYLELIKQNTPMLFDQIEEFTINDRIGGSSPAKIPTIPDISYSTLRYVKIASDLNKLFGDLKNWNIAEIGVGYGGQYLILDTAFKVGKYRLFDLRSVLELSKIYLDSFVLNSHYETMTLNEVGYEDEYDLVISNYAFSELPKPIQLQYLEKVITKAKHGFMIMNSGRGGGFDKNKMSFEEIQTYLPNVKLLKEDPLTYEFNYIMYW